MFTLTVSAKGSLYLLAVEELAKGTEMNTLFWYFDLYSQAKDGRARAQANDGSEISNWRQALIYSACLIGIFAGPFALGAAKGEYPTVAELLGSVSHILWSILFAAVLTAFLFKLLLKPTTPFIIQIGTALAVGIGARKVIPVALDALIGAVS